VAVRTTTLRTQVQLRWWIDLADRLAALRSSARTVRPETREPIPAYAFKDDPNFWLRSL
jgi:hypothetical protein